MTTHEREEMRRFLETLESDLAVETTPDSREQLRDYLDALKAKQERVNAAAEAAEKYQPSPTPTATRWKFWGAALGAALMWAALIKLLGDKQ
jgi:uncharacterized protein (DUF2236 family)